MTNGEFRLDLAELLEGLHTPVALRDVDYRIAYQNAAHRKFFGEARGQACHAVYWGETVPCPECPRALGVDPGGGGATRGGAARQGRCFSLEGGWAGHEVRLPAAGAEDVTGFLGRYFESSVAALFLEDLSGRILAMNRAAELLYGYERGEWLGRSVLDLFPEEVRPLFPEVQRQLEEQGTFWVETDQRRAGGGHFRAHVEGFRLDAPEPLVLVAVRDVTVATGTRDAHQARSQEFEHFLHSVAHDLRSPLAGIKGHANLIDRTLPDGSEVARDHLRTVLRQTERMESLLEGLLELSRIGRVEDLRLDLDVAASAQAAWQDLEEWVRGSGATLTLAGTFPGVRMAPVRLTQVFVNLFANAIKYAREGVPPQVEVAVVHGEPGTVGGRRAVCLRVRDNGVGVAPGEREEIFELFRQGSRVSREGSGLGLAIVRRIVATLGGRVWVGAEEGPGTSFYLTLPGTEKEP